MRINILGNILNWGMGFACLLREAGHEARVFINRRDMDFYQPSWEYPDFTPEKYPFVEFVDLAHWRVLAPGAREKAFLARLADCDVIQTFGEDALWAKLAGRPYVVLSAGFDLEFLPFSGWSPKALVRRALIRRAYAKAGAFVNAYLPYQKLVDRLGLKNAVFEPFAVPLDTNRYAPFPESEKRSLRSAWGRPWVFFHGARQEWFGRNGSGGNCKGNDLLFRAFARFAADHPDSLLVAVRKGKDVAKSEALIRELGITGQVRWIEEMTKNDLIKMINSVDAFCDQFAPGGYGVAALEALACGVPVFMSLGPARNSDIPQPPVQEGGTVDEIHARLQAFAKDPQAAKSQALAGRQWVIRHHSWEASAARYLQLYKNCMPGNNNGITKTDSGNR